MNLPTECPLPGHETPQTLNYKERSNHVFCPTHGLIHKQMLLQISEAQAGPEVTSAVYETPVPEPRMVEGLDVEVCTACTMAWSLHLGLAHTEMPGLRPGDPPKQMPRAVDLGDCVHILLGVIKEASRG